MALPTWLGSGATVVLVSVAGLLVVVLEAAAVVVVADETAVVVDPPLELVPTQYAYPPQKLVRQSSETAVFHARN